MENNESKFIGFSQRIEPAIAWGLHNAKHPTLVELNGKLQNEFILAQGKIMLVIPQAHKFTEQLIRKGEKQIKDENTGMVERPLYVANVGANNDNFLFVNDLVIVDYGSVDAAKSMDLYGFRVIITDSYVVSAKLTGQRHMDELDWLEAHVKRTAEEFEIEEQLNKKVPRNIIVGNNVKE